MKAGSPHESRTEETPLRSLGKALPDEQQSGTVTEIENRRGPECHDG